MLIIKEQKTIIIVMIIVFLFSSIFSFIKFYSFNPILSFIGVSLVLFTDTDHFVIQRVPNRVMIAKAGVSLHEYMEGKGFELVEQFGAIHLFKKDDKSVSVVTRGNGYFTRWRW